MKKIYSLLAVALVAMTASADTVTETFSVVTTDADGNVVRNEAYNDVDTTQASIVEFKTDHITVQHVSGPVASYIDGYTLPLEVEINSEWGSLQTKALSSDGSVEPFYYVQGKGNPVNLEKIEFEKVENNAGGDSLYRAKWDNAYYSPDGSNGFPTNGTYVGFTANVKGTMTANLWINKGNREIYVVKQSDAKALSFDEITVSGYINGTNWSDVADDSPLKGYPAYQENIQTKAQITLANYETEKAEAEAAGTEAPAEPTIDESNYYIIGQGNQAAWVYFSFPLEAGETYYIMNKNTQVGFGGFTFAYDSDDESGVQVVDAEEEAAAASAQLYNIAGQAVSDSYQGVVIKNGKKYFKK